MGDGEEGGREDESETPHSLLLRFALVSDLPLSRLQLTTARAKVAKEVNGSARVSDRH